MGCYLLPDTVHQESEAWSQTLNAVLQATLIPDPLLSCEPACHHNVSPFFYNMQKPREPWLHFI